MSDLNTHEVLPTVSIAGPAGPATEGSPLAFTLTRTGDLTDTLTVGLMAMPGSAMMGMDFTAPSQATFAAGEATTVVNVMTTDDAMAEGSESFTLQINPTPVYNIGAPSMASGTISDNDGAPPPIMPVVTISATDGVGTEALDGPDFLFTFTRTGDLTGPLAVSYNIMASFPTGAQPVQDFNGGFSGSVTFAAGSATATLSLEAFEDALVEGPESFTVSVGPSAGYMTGFPSMATGTIEDNEAIPVVSITPLNAVKAEGSGAFLPWTTYTFTVTRTGPTDQPLNVFFSTSGGVAPATDGADLSGGMISVFIPAGASSAVLTVNAEPDDAFEADENFTVTLTNPVGPAPGTSLYTVSATEGSASGTILNDDAPGLPYVLIDRTSVDLFGMEGFGNTEMSITFLRTGDLSQALTANYSVLPSNSPMNRPATPGVDFTGDLSGTVTFAADEASATIRFQVTEDMLSESPEGFSVELVDGVDYNLDDKASVFLTIHDNEPPPVLPTVSIAGPAGPATEGSPLAFTLTRTGDLTDTLTVGLMAMPGSAMMGMDFTAPSQATFAAGEATTVVNVMTTDDAMAEGTESFTLQINPTPVYNIGAPSMASGTISDNDGAPPPIMPVVTISATDGVGTEALDGPDFLFTFTRTGDLTGPLTVNYNILPGTAPEPGSTSTAPSRAQSPSRPAAPPRRLSLDAFDDLAAEGPESFTVSVAPPPPGGSYVVGAPFTATGTITDNDTGPPPVLPTVSIAGPAGPATEGSPLAFTLTRTGDLSGALNVALMSMAGTAIPGIDYFVPTAFFAAGEATATVNVTTSDDLMVEGSEMFSLQIGASPNYNIGAPAMASGTITDNDGGPPPAELPVVTIAATDGTGTETPDGPDFLFTFTRTGDLTGPLTVNYNIPPGTAQPGIDFNGPFSGSVTFAAGSATATLSLDAFDDLAAEGPESFTVSVEPPPAGGGFVVGAPITATGTITDNDRGEPPVW